jgi:hypothetical protein
MLPFFFDQITWIEVIIFSNGAKPPAALSRGPGIGGEPQGNSEPRRGPQSFSGGRLSRALHADR